MLDDVVADNKIEAVFREFSSLDVAQNPAGCVAVARELCFIDVDHRHLGRFQKLGRNKGSQPSPRLIDAGTVGGNAVGNQPVHLLKRLPAF